LATGLIVSALAQGFGSFKLEEKLARRVVTLSCQYSTPTVRYSYIPKRIQFSNFLSWQVRYTSMLSILLLLQRSAGNSNGAVTYVPDKKTLLSDAACVGLQSWNDLANLFTKLASNKFDIKALCFPFINHLVRAMIVPAQDESETPKGPLLFWLFNDHSDFFFLEMLLELLSAIVNALPSQSLAPHVSTMVKLLITDYSEHHKAVSKPIALGVRALLAQLDLSFPNDFDMAIDALCKVDTASVEHSIVSKSSWSFLFDNTRHQALKVDKSVTSAVAFVPTTLKHSLSASAPPNVIMSALETVFANHLNATDSEIAKQFSDLIKASVADLLSNTETPVPALIYLLQRNESTSVLSNIDHKKLLKMIVLQWIPKAVEFAKDKDPKLIKALFSFLCGPFVSENPSYTEEALVAVLAFVTYPNLDNGSAEFLAEGIKTFPHALLSTLNNNSKKVNSQSLLLARILSGFKDSLVAHSTVLSR